MMHETSGRPMKKQKRKVQIRQGCGYWTLPAVTEWVMRNNLGNAAGSGGGKGGVFVCHRLIAGE
jgi:hypothetical protein